VVVIGPLAGLASALVMVLTIWVSSPGLAALSFFLIGAGPLLWTISTTTLRQAVTPGEMLGRVSAVIVTATYGARPVGAAIGALVGSAAGAETCMVVAAVGFLVQALVIVGSPVARLAQQPGMAGDQRALSLVRNEKWAGKPVRHHDAGLRSADGNEALTDVV
jgi:hypothetical protein